jgi:hypothetical protein
MQEPTATPKLASNDAGALTLAALASPRSRAWVAGWAVGGVVLIFAEAIFRLGLRALETLRAGLSPLAWTVFLLISCAFAYGEGYRALQLRFAPRVIERAFAVDVRRRRDVVLAPLVALSLLAAAPREMARAYLAVGLIVAAALLVSAMPWPWRGIVDGAVAIALSWGALALLLQFASARKAAS